MLNFFRTGNIDKQLAERRPRLYRLAFSWCGDAMLADDLVQETLNKALVKQSQLNDFSHVDAWLFRILHNCWMGYLRTNKPSIDIDDVNLINEQSPDKKYNEQQVIERVRNGVEMLPLTQRQVVTLVDLENCSYTQVAVILDIPMGTVMSRLSRARALLKKYLIGMQKQGSYGVENPSHNHLRRVK
ncbi:MAG: RNA polymerase sigma factor [Thiotrichaceae bacterium]